MVWHIFRKDLRLLWPMALLVAVCQACVEMMVFTENTSGGKGALLIGLLVCWFVSTELLIILSVQQDALPGVDQDWLTRPVRRRDLLLAKVVFILLTVQSPFVVTGTLHGLIDGFTFTQSLTAALSTSACWLFMFTLPAFAIGALTRNLTEALLGALGTLIAFSLTVWGLTASLPHFKLLDPVQTGAVWLQHSFIISVIAIAVALAVWQQYSRRRLRLARVIFLGLSALVLLAPALPLAATLSVQQWFSTDRSADYNLTMDFDPAAGQLHVQPDQGVVSSSDEKNNMRTMVKSEWAQPSEGFAGVYLPIRLEGLPAGTALISDWVTVHITDEHGKRLFNIPGDNFDIAPSSKSNSGQAIVHQGIWLPERYFSLLRDRTLNIELDYSLTLLKQEAAQSMPAFDGDKIVENTEHCKTTYDGDQVDVDCASAGAQAPCMAISLDRMPGDEHILTNYVCEPNYAPYPMHMHLQTLAPPTRLTYFRPETNTEQSAWHTIDNSRPTDTRVSFSELQAVDHFKRHVMLSNIHLGDWQVDDAGLGGGHADGKGSAASFSHPRAVAVDGHGTAYVADDGNNTIRKISPDGVVTTLAGSPGRTGSANGKGAAALFRHPRGIVMDNDGNILTADKGNDIIRKITPTGSVTTLPGMAGHACMYNDNGPYAHFCNPDELAKDNSGNIYVTGYDSADDPHNGFLKITPSGSVQKLVGLKSEYSDAGMTVDGTGNIYTADQDSKAIYEQTPGAATQTLAVSPPAGALANEYGAHGIHWGLAVDAQNNIYIAFTANNTILKRTPAGVVTTLAGSAGQVGNTDGKGAAARFNQPEGLAVDSKGNIYVADTYNNMIRKITPDGLVSTLAGTTAHSTEAVVSIRHIITRPWKQDQ